MDWIWTEAEKLGGVATMFAALVGLCALVPAAWQIVSAKSVALRISAIEAYQSYMRSCIDRPHLGTWKMFVAWSGHTSAEQLEDQSDVKAEAYVWLLSDMLMTCELALYAARSDKSWLDTIHGQIKLHEPAIRALWPRWRLVYSPSLRRIVDASLARLAT